MEESGVIFLPDKPTVGAKNNPSSVKSAEAGSVVKQVYDEPIFLYQQLQDNSR
jgi:hypothetical protein